MRGVAAGTVREFVRIGRLVPIGRMRFGVCAPVVCKTEADVMGMARHFVDGQLMRSLAAGITDLVRSARRSCHEERPGSHKRPGRSGPSRCGVDGAERDVHVIDAVRAYGRIRIAILVFDSHVSLLSIQRLYHRNRSV